MRGLLDLSRPLARSLPLARACSSAVPSANPPLPFRLVQFQNHDASGQPRVGAQLVDRSSTKQASASGSRPCSLSGEFVDVTADAPVVASSVKKLLESGDLGLRAVKQ